MAILDETDSGLGHRRTADRLSDVINEVRRERPEMGVLL